MPKHCIIQVGSRVEGPYGELETNQHPKPDARARRIRSRVCGTVIRACGPKTWIVLFDYNGQEKECASSLLKLVPPLTGVPVEQICKKVR